LHYAWHLRIRTWADVNDCTGCAVGNGAQHNSVNWQFELAKS
jgi:hypothetical protein